MFKDICFLVLYIIWLGRLCLNNLLFIYLLKFDVDIYKSYLKIFNEYLK